MKRNNDNGTVIRNYIKSNVFLTNSILDKNSRFQTKTATYKRKEVADLAIKYSLSEVVAKRIIKDYLLLEDLEIGSITKSVDFISYILKSIYDYTDEEVSNFLNRNALIMVSSYSDLKLRICIFNYIGLLDEAIFKGSAFLTHEFTKTHYGTRSMYAIIMKNNIKSLEELRDRTEKTPEKDLQNLRKEFPITDEVIKKLAEKLQSRIKKAQFFRELEQRKMMKKLGDQ